MSSCNDNIPITEIKKEPDNPYKENMMTASNYVAKSEEKEIDSYVKRRGWDDKIKRYDNGLRLWQYEKGTNVAVEYEDEVIISYNLQSIAGKDIYNNVLDTVVVGKNMPNVGVDKALLHLNYGSKAILILPSHIGYGFIGDDNRIGTNMILVYDIEVKAK